MMTKHVGEGERAVAIAITHTHTEPLRHDIFFADDVKLVCLYVMRNTLITMLMTLASNKIDN